MTKQSILLAENDGYTAYLLNRPFNPQWPYYKRQGYCMAQKQALGHNVPSIDYSQIWPYSVIKTVIDQSENQK